MNNPTNQNITHVSSSLEFEEWHANLMSECSELGILHDPSKLSIKPLYLEKSRVDRWITDTRTLVQVCRRIAEYERHKKSKPREDHSDVVAAFLSRDRMPPILRPDGVIIDGELKFFELNIDSSLGGISEIDLIGNAVAKNPLSNQNLFGNIISPKVSFINFFKDIEKIASQSFDCPINVVVTCFSDEVQYYIDECAEFARWINAHTNMNAFVAFPESLRAGAFVTDGLRDYHVIYRYGAVLVDPQRAASMLKMMKAVALTRSLILSDPADLLIEHKGILAILSEALRDDGLFEEERCVVERLVPWTRFVRAGIMDFDGSFISTEQLLKSLQSQLVLKSCFSYRGEGVVIGAEVDRRVWENLVERVLLENIPWVVQRNLSSSSYKFQYFSQDRGVWEREQRFTISPYIFGDQFGGMLIRTELDATNRVLSLPTNDNMGLSVAAMT